MLKVNNSISIPLKEIDFTFSRSSGPGGQNVNKVNSKVLLRWNINQSGKLKADLIERIKTKYSRRINADGEFLISSQRFRDQGRNVADCLNKLRTLVLEVAEPPKTRKKRQVSRNAKMKRLTNKRIHSEKKKLRKPPNLDR